VSISVVSGGFAKISTKYQHTAKIEKTAIFDGLFTRFCGRENDPSTRWV